MKKLLLSTSMILPILLLAHPGHGDTDGYTIIHYFAEPMHAVITVGAIVGAFFYIINHRKAKKVQKEIIK